jgi:leucyl aminopeptidase
MICYLLSSFKNQHPTNHSVEAATKWVPSLWEGYVKHCLDVTIKLHNFLGGKLSWLGLNAPSVILTIPGTDFPDEVVVLAAHLDSESDDHSFTCSFNPDCLAPGADDNASGIAALSEVI